MQEQIAGYAYTLGPGVALLWAAWHSHRKQDDWAALRKVWGILWSFTAGIVLVAVTPIVVAGVHAATGDAGPPLFVTFLMLTMAIGFMVRRIHGIMTATGGLLRKDRAQA